MEKKALGRGLSALISSGRQLEEVLKKEIPLEPHSSTGKEVAYIPVAQIVPNKFQPRTDFDEARMGELIASVKEKGVLAPILVRPVGEGRFEIIAGERRFRAARALRIDKVPVVIRDVNDTEALVLSIVENVQRQELNPIEEARAFDRLCREFSYTQEHVARAVSKDRSTVANTLRLLSLPAEIQNVISEGRLSFGHGKALLSIDSVAQQVKLTQLVLSKSLSVRELENFISTKRLSSVQRRKASKEKDPYVADLEAQLQKSLGTKVRIFAFKKRGRIQIEYYSTEDRERLIKLLKRA